MLNRSRRCALNFERSTIDSRFSLSDLATDG